MSDWQRSQLQCRHEGRQNWLHAKRRTLSERQGSGRERRPKWRLLQGSKLTVWTQNDRIFFFSRRMRASEVIFRTLAKERHRSRSETGLGLRLKRKPFPHPQSKARSKHFRVNVRLATFPAAVSSRRPPELAARQKKDTL